VLSVNEWVVQWGEQEAEIHRAAAADLAGFIRSGELPS
jgi:hypothetical protein